jgi:transcriptional regulator with XRE-family HTH domain
MNTLGQQLRALREMKKFGVRELAKRACVDPGYITRLEGDQKMPSYETLLRLSHELGVSQGALEPYVIGALYGNWINGGHSPFEIRRAP